MVNFLKQTDAENPVGQGKTVGGHSVNFCDTFKPIFKLSRFGME